MGLYFCCTFAELAALAENAPKPSSARRTPARITNRPIKMRGSRKANRETDFFFMSGHDVDKILAKWSLPGSVECICGESVGDGDAAACLLPACHGLPRFLLARLQPGRRYQVFVLRRARLARAQPGDLMSADALPTRGKFDAC